jgi:hypothetical protein
LALNPKIARAAAARVRLNEDALRKACGELPQLGEPGDWNGELEGDLCVHVVARGHSVFVAAPRSFAESLSKSILGVEAGARGALLYVVIAAIARADLDARCEGFVERATGDLVFPLRLLGAELRVIVPAELFVQ